MLSTKLTHHLIPITPVRCSAHGNGAVGNGNGAVGNGTASSRNDFGPDLPIIDWNLPPARLCEQLVQIVNTLTSEDGQVDLIQQLIKALESRWPKPSTSSFTELALSGEWNLLFSSTRTQPKDSVRIRSISQSFDIEKKLMLNSARWSFPNRSGSDEIFAELIVTNEYSFVEAGRLQIELKSHNVRLEDRQDGKKHEMPEDMDRVIKEMQLSLPVEHFDPSGLVDVSYLEPGHRIARFQGKRLAGVRNIFEKV